MLLNMYNRFIGARDEWGRMLIVNNKKHGKYMPCIWSHVIILYSLYILYSLVLGVYVPHHAKPFYTIPCHTMLCQYQMHFWMPTVSQFMTMMMNNMRKYDVHHRHHHHRWSMAYRQAISLDLSCYSSPELLTRWENKTAK